MMLATRWIVSLTLASTISAPLAHGQQPLPASIDVAPAELDLEVGDSVQLDVVVRDASGDRIADAPVIYLPVRGPFWNHDLRTWGFNLFKVSPDGLVSASKPGEYAVLLRVPTGDDKFIEREIPLHIAKPSVTEVEFVDPPTRFITGTTVRLRTRFRDPTGALRDDVLGGFRSSDSSVAVVDELGNLRLLSPGHATITAMADDASAALEVRVEESSSRRLTLEIDTTGTGAGGIVRTGDVVRFRAQVLDEHDRVVEGAPVTFSFNARVDPYQSGGPSTGLVSDDGRFVADLPGEYTLIATSGSLSAQRVIAVSEREARRQIELVGHGRVRDSATTDLWVWEGTDGDYAITGTHGGGGLALVWDVTDPAEMEIIDTVKVDARNVNDLKVSADGKIAVISREGASTRRNGIVVLDVSSPRQGVEILSSYDDELTGGVHNLFVYEDHVYALSAGQRYDIISIEDPTAPHRVGRFELPNPDRSIHDVWVQDGIAYSSNWNDGVVMVDVGGGGRGGSPRSPVMIGKSTFRTGWNHAVFPYRSTSGKHYIFAGDEAARSGRFSPEPERGAGTPGYDGEPNRWRGWVHILEWEPGSDEEPELVARYEVPEAGSHNIWVENDVMYVAFYNGGLRVVDVSGELRGDLYRQGREMARFLPYDPEGFLPNAPQVWGAQPFKGNIFFSDYNSGLWAVRLSEQE